jgi:hypothetical protein
MKKKKQKDILFFFVPEIIEFYEHYYIAKKTASEREREFCVCMWHMELLVVDSRRQAAVMD